MNEQSREQGAAIVLVAFALVFLGGLAAIVVDVGYARQVRRQAQNAADAGALAAVVDYNGTPATENAARAGGRIRGGQRDSPREMPPLRSAS